MNIRTTLARLADVIAKEAGRNPAFARSLEDVLGDKEPAGASRRSAKTSGRRAGRRAAAVLDPVAIAQQGEGELRTSLKTLELEKLLDIVAEYGMDPGKLVMKWKDPDRVIDRIVELSLARSTKGDVFRLE